VWVCVNALRREILQQSSFLPLRNVTVFTRSATKQRQMMPSYQWDVMKPVQDYTD